MPLIDHLLGNQTIRKAIWRLWYPYHFVKPAEAAD